MERYGPYPLFICSSPLRFLAPQNIQSFDYVNKALLSYLVGKFMLQLHLRGLKCFQYNLESNDFWVYTIVSNSLHIAKKRKTISNYTTTYLAGDIMQSLNATVMTSNPMSGVNATITIYIGKRTKDRSYYTAS